MARKKGKRILSRMSTVYMITIVSLSIMGVGYGYWSDNLNLGVSITTGDLNGRFIQDESYIEGLSMSLVDEGRILEIAGEVHHGFNQELSVGILNNGTIPFNFQGEEVGVNETLSYSILISIPEKDITIPTVTMVSFDNSMMLEYDESAMIAQQIQEIDQLIQSLNIIEYYNNNEALKVEQFD